MTDFVLNVLNSNFVVAICTLLGTLVGAHLSARYVRREENAAPSPSITVNLFLPIRILFLISEIPTT